MPASVQAANPVAVMPFALCRAFSQVREWPVDVNDYRDGESQRSLLAESSRKRWRLTSAMTVEQAEELLLLYDARNGPAQEFYFYDPWETDPKFTYDPTGVAEAGRYAVRFDGPFELHVGMALKEVLIELVQVS